MTSLPDFLLDSQPVAEQQQVRDIRGPETAQSSGHWTQVPPSAQWACSLVQIGNISLCLTTSQVTDSYFSDAGYYRCRILDTLYVSDTNVLTVLGKLLLFSGEVTRDIYMRRFLRACSLEYLLYF